MDHAFFIWTSYGVSAVTVIALFAWIMVTSRSARAHVEALEAGASHRGENR